MTSTSFIQYYKKSGFGWLRMEDLPVAVQKDLMRRLARCDKRIGVFVYHSHEGNPQNGIRFVGMKVGYYVRSKNPFSWKFRATAGNNK